MSVSQKVQFKRSKRIYRPAAHRLSQRDENETAVVRYLLTFGGGGCFICVIKCTCIFLHGPGKRGRYGASIRARRSGDRFPVGVDSPDLASSDVYLYPRLKSVQRGRRFYDATDVMKNATEEQKRFSQNGFQECFQHLYN
jgi:hypothetical protein